MLANSIPVLSEIPLTWGCHVCKEGRLDRFVSVYTISGETLSGIVFKVNVRYCNDRQACIDGAPAVAEEWAKIYGKRKHEEHEDTA